MKKYRVKQEIRPYVRQELARCHFHCQMTEEEGQLWCYTNAPSDTFHKIVKRARCVQKTEETGIPFLTSEEFHNPLVRDTLLRHPGNNAYGCCILETCAGM